MTISVTLHPHVPSAAASTNHRDSRRSHRSNMNSTPSSSLSLTSSPSRKVRPYRKLQPYHHHHMNHPHQQHPGCQYPTLQMLSNGYTVLPMLSLHDAALMNYKQQQQQQQQQQQHSQMFTHYSEQASGISNRLPYSLLESSSFSLLQPSAAYSFDQGNAVSTMFPSLTPTITTVLPSPISQHDEINEVTSDESSSQSSNNTKSLISTSSSSGRTDEKSRTSTTAKRVRFAPTATMHTIPEVSEEDAYNSWYQIENYNAFELDNRNIVTYINKSLKEYYQIKDLSKLSINVLQQSLYHILQNDPTNPLLTYETLGLEQFLYGPKYMYERRQETIHHNLMVLEMYDVQRTTQHYHPHVLRRVSERFSIQNVERAIQRAVAATTTMAKRTTVGVTQQQQRLSSTSGSIHRPTAIRNTTAIGA